MRSFGAVEPRRLAVALSRETPRSRVRSEVSREGRRSRRHPIPTRDQGNPHQYQRLSSFGKSGTNRGVNRGRVRGSDGEGSGLTGAQPLGVAVLSQQ